MTWLFAAAGIAALIVIHEAGHAIAARACGMRVLRFALFFPPILVRRTIRGTEFAIGTFPLGGYVKIAGQSLEDEIEPGDEERSYSAKPIWQRAVVIAAGPAANLVAAIVIFASLLMFHGSITGTSDRIANAALEPPAAGILKPGDRIVAIDGKRGSAERLVRQTRSHSCPGIPTEGCVASTPAVVTFVREGKERTIPIAPRWDSRIKAMRLGFSFDAERERLGPVAAVGRSLALSAEVTVAALRGLASIITPEGRRQVSGIVGVSVVTEKAVANDAVQALQLLALISLAIAIFNLIPLLPLDGGHLFWLLVEKLRGRPASQETLGRATAVGLVLVVGLFFIGLSNDMLRLTGEGFRLPR